LASLDEFLVKISCRGSSTTRPIRGGIKVSVVEVKGVEV
jgi:hypothetical protein